MHPLHTLSIGKFRALQQCSTESRAFVIMALDHRNNLRRVLNPAAPDSVSDATLIQFKDEVVRALAPAASAVLLDPEFSAAQCIVSGALPPQTGLVVALEATGYTGDTAARSSQVLEGWSVAKAKRMGANGVKLLVYYHPDAPTAPHIEALVKQVAGDCAAHELPLFLEPLSYSPDPARKHLLPDERQRVVIETARRLTLPGVDVLKAEFPVDIAHVKDDREWLSACRELSQASAVPWILLSASVDFETFCRQVEVACEAGASGVAVGRAVWQEAVMLDAAVRSDFLISTARQRMTHLSALCNTRARPWSAFFVPPHIGEGWYRGY